jgi:hypothetical protein
MAAASSRPDSKKTLRSIRRPGSDDGAIDAEGTEGSANNAQGPNPARLLLELALDRYDLITSEEGRSFAVAKKGPNLALPLEGKRGNALRPQLAAAFYEEHDKVANSGAQSDCMTVLEALASRQPPTTVYVRMGRQDSDEHGRTVIVDTGDPDAERFIVITGSGWRIESTSPVVFRRTNQTNPMVDPVRGGTLDGLRALLNLADEDFRLVIGWVVAAYLTDMPHPMLLIQGEQGTAKTSLIRALLALIDPAPSTGRPLPPTPGTGRSSPGLRGRSASTTSPRSPAG